MVRERSRLLAVLVLGVVVTGVAGISRAAVVDGSGLAVYFTFDEGQGMVAVDHSGNGNDGTIFGGAAFVPGRAGSALSFDGVDDYIEVPDSTSLHITNAVTLDFWMNAQTYPPNAVRIIQKDFFAPGGPAWSQLLFYGDPNVGTGILTFRPVSDITSVQSPPLSLNRWYNVAATYDSATSLSCLYLDGALVASSTSSSGPIPIGSAPLRIGAAGWVTTHFNGILDEVQIYDRALSPDEISSLLAMQVIIDIKPGSYPNTINMKSNGNVPVAILSTSDFNASTQVDKASLTFGRTGYEHSLVRCGNTGEDVNGDGLWDLVCHFATQKTGFNTGDKVGILRGETVTDIPIEGRDSVVILNG